MRIKVYVKEFKNKLEIYSDSEGPIDLELLLNGEPLHVKIDEPSRNKKIFYVKPGDCICYADNLSDKFTFSKKSNGNWECMSGTHKKTIKDRKNYLFALKFLCARRGMFHNIQKENLFIYKYGNHEKATWLQGVYAHGDLEDRLGYDLIETFSKTIIEKYTQILSGEIEEATIKTKTIVSDDMIRNTILFLWRSNINGNCIARGYLVDSSDKMNIQIATYHMKNKKQII